MLSTSLSKRSGMSLSGRQGSHQLVEPDEIEHPPEIVGERGQAEFGTNLLQSTHQKRALVHPLLDRAERVFDRLATSVENIRALRQSRLHPVQYCFVLKARHRAKPAARASWADRAIVAGHFVGVVDLLQPAQKRK